MLKASLHVHVDGDHDDYIQYSGFELLDEAAERGYQVVAFTCHERVVIHRELRDHARDLGILLIPGIELNLGGHVLVLNADQDATAIRSLEDLARYRERRPDIFTIAAHPFFPHRKYCFQERIHNHLQLFDAIEHSWFYSPWINWNKPAKALAEKHGLPYIATADVHSLEMLNNGHVLIDADKNIESVFEALRNHRFESVAQPQSVLGMWWKFAKMNWNMAKKILPWSPPHIPFSPIDEPETQSLPSRPEIKPSHESA